MSIISGLTSVYYTILLVGGLNWLAVGARLIFDNSVSVCEPASGDQEPTTIIPDLLSWAGETVQIVVYYIVGASALLLLVFGILGHWVRAGPGMISIDLKTVEVVEPPNVTS